MDDVFDESKDLVLFDPQATWKKTHLKGGTYTMKELMVKVFDKGECIYQSPSVMEIPGVLQERTGDTVGRDQTTGKSSRGLCGSFRPTVCHEDKTSERNASGRIKQRSILPKC